MRCKLPELLVKRALAPDIDKAIRMIGAGEIFVDGQLADKAGLIVSDQCEISLKHKRKYVSRGGYKLEAALKAFDVDITGIIAADIGASTGGFTDCLLQHGAAKVYAIDVAYGELAWHLRQDKRVRVIERTNARYLESLPEPVGIIVSDLSFISLKTVYATAVNWFGANDNGNGCHVVSLIKPQFEAPADQVGEGGVVRDPEVHRKVLRGVIDDFAELGLHLQGLIVSPITGPAGNVEFLGWWMMDASHNVRSAASLIDASMKQALQLGEYQARNERALR